MKDVWEFAKEMEKQGQAYYITLANESTIPEIAGVFNFLAREEQRHFELFDNMQKGIASNELRDSDVVVTVKKAFENIAAGMTEPSVVENAETLYRKALDMETKSVGYYVTMLEKAEEAQKRTIQFIIDQEKMHQRILEGIISFVHAPKDWLENAEWNHLDTL